LLLSLFLLLEAGGFRSLPPTLGRAAHAGFLKLVERLDSGLAERLHGVPEKPFTVFLFQRGEGRSGSRLSRGPWLRITSLDESLSRLLLKLAEDPDGIGTLRLLSDEFKIIGVYRDPAEHPWAGGDSYAELYDNWLVRAKEEGLPRIVGLRFQSPTAFRMSGSGLSVPLPAPRLVFQSLLDKWNRFSPIHLELTLDEVERHVGITRYALETRMLDFGGYKQIGFVGDCWFFIDRRAEGEERLSRLINLLADFAFYAGIGRKTTMGMGQARRIE